jgi:hypothetical protein
VHIRAKSVPNPIFFFLICRWVGNHWTWTTLCIITIHWSFIY